MQPTDSYTVPRRSLDVEDYIDILRRHKGWIFGPFLLCVVASVVGVFLWPDSYLSEAKVKITPQQLPESMLPSAINQQMFDRIESMRQSILSRSVLTAIIQNKGLYRKELTRMPMDDVVEKMRKDISVGMFGGPAVSANRVIPAFSISFSYENKYLAQAVVQDLMGRFIDQNVRDNNTRTVQSTQFFKDEADLAKKELEEIENKMTEFQVQNNGHLPDQADSNMRSLMTLETQLSVLNGNLNRAANDKLQLESNLNILKDQTSAITKQAAELPTQASMNQRNEKLLDAEREVSRLEDALRLERQKHGETHPDVVTLVGMLDIAKQKKARVEQEDNANKEEASKKDGKAESVARANPALQRELIDRDGRMKQLVTSIETKALEIEQINKDIKQLNTNIAHYQGLIQSVPVGARTYMDLIRDREMAKQKYVDLSDKLDKAQRSQDMENRNQGERLEPLDTASLPTDPTEPKRPMVISIGAGLGLLLGIAIAGAREMKDTSLKNLKDVRAYTQMSVLGSIPLLENDFVVKRRRRLAWLGWTTACLVAVVVMVGAIVYYESTRGGVQ